MVKSLILTNYVPNTYTANFTWWHNVSGSTLGAWSNSAYTYANSRPAGVYSNLRTVVTANTLTSGRTATIRLYSANAYKNNLVTIGTGLTGVFEDTTHTDSISNGALTQIALLFSSSSATESITISQISLLFEVADGYFYSQCGILGASNISTASVTNFIGLNSMITFGITDYEASTQTKFKSPATLSRFLVYVYSNTRTTANTYCLRKNGSDTALSISGTGTGILEDVTDTVSIAADDLVNFAIRTGTGTGTTSPWNWKVSVSSSDRQCLIGNTNSFAQYGVAGTVKYLTPLSNIIPHTSEDPMQVKVGIGSSYYWQKFNLYIHSNNCDAASTITCMKNGSTTSMAISIPAGNTGRFENTTNSEGPLSTTDLIDIQLDCSASSSGGLALTNIYSELGPAPLAVVLKSLTLKHDVLQEVEEITNTLIYDIEEAPPQVTFFSKMVSVLSNSGTGTQDITFTADPAWTPKVAIVQYSRPNIAVDTFHDGVGRGYGFTDGTNSRSIAIVSEDATASADTATVQSNNALITALNQTGTITTVDAVASFSQWLENGMRINWTNAPTAAFYIHVLFLGGDDLTNFDVGTLLSTTGTSPISVSSLSYKPDFAMFLMGRSATENSGVSNMGMCVGAATDPSAQWSQSCYHVDNSGSNAGKTVYSSDRVLQTITTAVDGYATLASFNTNGLTLNIGDAFPANIPIYYLCMKGGQYSVGTATEPASPTTQDVTTNTDVKTVMVFGTDSPTNNTVANGNMWTSGMGTASDNQGCETSDELYASDPMATASRHDTDQIYLNITANATATSSTLDDEAALSAIADTGFTLNWTNVGQARPFRFITFGNAIQLASVTMTSTYLWDLFKEATSDIDTLKWDIIAEVTDTNTLRFDLCIPVIKSGTLIHHVLQEVAKTNTLRYDIFMDVVKAYSLLHNVDMEIATAKVLNILYDVTTSLTATKTFIHNVLNEITDTTTLNYDIITELIKTNSLIYDIETQALASVTKTFTSLFNVDVAMLTAKTLTLLHNISQEVTTSKTLIYDVFQEATKSATLLHDVLQQIIDTNTLSYDITVNVEKAMTLIADILKEIDKANIFRFDVTVETLAKQLTLLHDIIGEITKTETVRFNVDNIMTKTSSFLFDIYEGLQVIKALNILFNVDQEFTTEPRNIPYNIDTEIAPAETIIPYNIDVEVAKSYTLPVEILAELTKTGTFRYDTIQETVKSATFVFNTIQEIVKSGTFIYDLEAVGQVIKTMNVLYNVDKILQTSARVFNWNITKEVEKTRTFRYDVTQSVEAQFDVLYSLFQQVIKGTDLRYDISKAVTKLFIGLYQITQAVQRSRTLRHSIDQETTKTAAFVYDVTVPMLTAKAYNLVYDVLQTVESDPKTMNWDIIAQTTKTTSLIYDIYTAVMAAIKTTTLLYNIDKTMSASKTMRYDVTVRVDKTMRLVFDLLHKVVSKSKVFRYDMQSQVTRTRTFKFNVTNELRKESSFLFNVLNTVATENELLFEILASRTKQLKTRYAIQHEVAKTRTLRHNISQFVESLPKTFNWDLLQEIETAEGTTIKYEIVQEMAMRARFKWNLLQELVHQNTLMFDMLQETPEIPVSFRYDIIAQTTKLLKLYYDIDNTITKAHRFVYSIIPTTVITPKTALHERLLDYIISQYNIADPPKNEILWHEWYNGIADITIDSIFLTAKVIPDKSTLIYKDRVYRCAIHIFYRVGKPDQTNANNPTEYVNVINHISNILSRSRYNLYYDLGYNVYECRVVDAYEIPDMYDPQNTEPVGKIRHYRFLIDLFYQKLIT